MKRVLRRLTNAQTMHGFDLIGSNWIGDSGSQLALDPETEFSPRNSFLNSVVATFPSYVYTKKAGDKTIVFTNRDGKLPTPNTVCEELGQNNDFGILFNAVQHKAGRPNNGVFVIPIIDNAIEQHIALTVIDVNSKQIVYIDSKDQPYKPMFATVKKKFELTPSFNGFNFKIIITEQQSFADEVTCGYQVLTLSEIVLNILSEQEGDIKAITLKNICQKINELTALSLVAHAQNILRQSREHITTRSHRIDESVKSEQTHYIHMTDLLNAALDFWDRTTDILASAWSDTYADNSRWVNAISFLPKFFCEFLPKSVELASQFLRDKLMTVGRNNIFKRAGTTFALIGVLCIKKLAQYTRILLRPLSSPLKSLEAARLWRRSMLEKHATLGKLVGSIAVVGSVLITVIGWTAIILASLGTTIPAVAAALGTAGAGIITSAVAAGSAISTTTGTIATASAVGGTAVIATGIYTQNQKNKKAAPVAHSDVLFDEEWDELCADGNTNNTSVKSLKKHIPLTQDAAETRFTSPDATTSANTYNLWGGCGTETEPNSTQIFSRSSSPVH